MAKVSIYCSGVRPELWPKYKNLESNKVDFEIIFAGDVRPDFPLPPYMKHIYTTVKPAQCYFIAGLQSQGDYLFNISDDMVLSDNGFLDNLLNTLQQHDESNTIVTPRYLKHEMTFFGRHYDTPLAVGSFCSRKLWEKYPIDKNFVSLYWDVDNVMSNHQDGGKVVVCEESTTMDVDVGGTPMFNRFNDLDLFWKLWTRQTEFETGMPNGLVAVLDRLVEREPLVDSQDLLVKSQGRTGIWT